MRFLRAFVQDVIRIFPVEIFPENGAVGHLFQRDEDAESLNLLLHAPIVPPTAYLPELGAAWDAFFFQALARDPAQRFQSAREMQHSLDAILDLEGVPRPGEFESYMMSLPSLPGEGGDAVTQPPAPQPNPTP